MEDCSVRFVSTIADVGPGIWQAIAGSDHPFTRYEFLSALEQSGATGDRSGWQVSHAVVDVRGRTVALMPLYVKYHGYGEWRSMAAARRGIRWAPTPDGGVTMISVAVPATTTICDMCGP